MQKMYMKVSSAKLSQPRAKARYGRYGYNAREDAVSEYI